MIVEWQQQGERLHDVERCCAHFPLLADSCQTVEGLVHQYIIGILLVNNGSIRRINAKHRHADYVTDVLSFPTVSYSEGKTAKNSLARLQKEIDPDRGGVFLGEIVLSGERARAQAKQYGHELQRELSYLFTHGIFHLMGYDHNDPLKQKEMRLMEEKALQLAGISRDNNAPAPTDNDLLAMARLAMQRAYTPYSHFKVGACLLASDGRVFQGCNIENASFGLTNCAERTAVFKAVSDGAKDFVAIAIAAENAPPYPCGACRQVLNEFAPQIRILITWGKDKVELTTLPDLLPHSFGPNDLP